MSPLTSGAPARVALCGTGRWGQVVAASLGRSRRLQLVAACDPSDEARGRLQAGWPGLPAHRSLDPLLDDPAVDAVLVATPPAEHAACAARVLAAGKHVFVEKPLALSAVEATDLVRTAGRAGRVLFVGHILLHHPAVRALLDLQQRGALGQIRYIEAVRAGAPRGVDREGPLWSLGPHDVAVALALLGELPARVSARPVAGEAALLHLWLQFPSGAQMSLRLGRLLEARERRLTVVGTRGAACFDDSGPRPRLRTGPPVTELPLPAQEPLLLELEAFAGAMGGQTAELLCSGAGGVQVVQVLEACARSLAQGGQTVPVLPDREHALVP